LLADCAGTIAAASVHYNNLIGHEREQRLQGFSDDPFFV